MMAIFLFVLIASGFVMGVLACRLWPTLGGHRFLLREIEELEIRIRQLEAEAHLR